MRQRRFSEEQIVGILLDAENVRLKWLVADQALANQALQDRLRCRRQRDEAALRTRLQAMAA